MIIDNVFSSFLVRDRLNLDFDAVQKYCYNEMKASEGRILSNRGGWQSSDLFVDQFNKTLFVNPMIHSAREFLSTVGENQNIKLSNFWININRKHNYNTYHTHPGTIFSGVLYVKTPENCGGISFVNPISDLIEAYKLLAHYDPRGPSRSKYYQTNLYFNADQGDAFFFPAWIPHTVEPNQSDEDRISIAFNFVYER